MIKRYGGNYVLQKKELCKEFYRCKIMQRGAVKFMFNVLFQNCFFDNIIINKCQLIGVIIKNFSGYLVIKNSKVSKCMLSPEVIVENCIMEG